jgi:hypothetical protein
MADRRYYAKIDVGYLDNPKIAPLVEAQPRSVLLHLWCITYSRQHGTDGIVPMRIAMRHACAAQCDLDVLLQCGLLVQVDELHVEVHDYLEHQDSAASLKKASDLARRAAEARWKDGQDDAERNADRTADRNAKERRGEERKKSRTATRSAANEPDRFEEFWAAYPRRSDKGHARTAYAKALKKTDPESLILGAKKYATSQAGTDPKYIALPTTWLNGERWTDEPTTTADTAPSPWDRPTITDRRMRGEL